MSDGKKAAYEDAQEERQKEQREWLASLNPQRVLWHIDQARVELLSFLDDDPALRRSERDALERALRRLRYLSIPGAPLP
jgi:hypothetical protein